MDVSSISSVIANTINEIFDKIFASIDNSLYSILDEFTFIDTDILNDSHFSNILGTNSSQGILVIANAFIFGYLLYYSVKLLLAHLGITQVEKPSQFLFKLILYAITMNCSFFICEQIISIISLFSSSIRELGENLFHVEICFSSLITRLNSVFTDENAIDFFSLDGILKTFISLGLLNLVITYAVRFVLIKIFVLLSPFAILSLSSKSTSILFRSWMKSFLSLMLIQVFVSIILLLIFSLKVTAINTFSKLILIASIFVLIKANQYVREMLGGISSDVNMGMNQFKSMMMK